MVLPAIAILIISAVALVVGLIGRRRGTELCCRKCEHIVEGIQASQCPECGTNIDAQGTTVRGGRHRNFVLLWLAVIGLIVTGPIVVMRSHRALIAPGWQQVAPAWWLTNVEIKFATGVRFDEACSGVSLANRNGKLTAEQLDAAVEVVFDRLRSEPVSRMPMHSASVFEFAGLMGAKPDCDVTELCRVVRTCAFIPVHVDEDTVFFQVEKPTFAFLPKGWEMKCTYVVESPGDAGNPVVIQGSGTVGSNGTGRRSTFKSNGGLKESGTYQVIWTIEVCRVGEGPSASWVEKRTFAWDNAKAKQFHEDRARKLREQAEERQKKISAQRKAWEEGK